ncbi:MAG: amidohydrolase family protein [Clostridia bacterium]|nr:amidohydrolase family protein [Clostridia bacterium]
MIVDFHTHTFPPAIAEAALTKLSAASRSRAFTKGTPADLVASMQKAGVDRSVVLPVATNPLKVTKMNDISLAETEKNGLIYFGCMHPDAENALEEVDRMANRGLKGFKIHPVYQGVDINDPRFLRILDRAGERDLCVVMHAGDDIGFPGVVRCSPEMTAAALKQVGCPKLILAHMGGWKNWERVADALADTGVYLDTSFSLGEIPAIDDTYSPEEKKLLKAEEFCALVRAFGAERILFGTDSPWTDQKESLEAIRALPLTLWEQKALLGGNAQRLLGI